MTSLTYKKTFKPKPPVAYQIAKSKSLSDYLLKNDIVNQQFHSNVSLMEYASLARK